MGVRPAKTMCEEIYTVTRTQNGWLVYVGLERYTVEGHQMYVAPDKTEALKILDELMKD